MSKVIFGTIWLAFTSFITFIMYGNKDGSITINGQEVGQEAFAQILWPKLLLGCFFAMGLWILISGIIKLFRNMQTKILGRETYGLILDILHTDTYVNGRPEWKAEILVATEHNGTEMFTEIIGFNPMKYQPGKYVLLKHYKKDINLIKTVLPHSI